MFCAKCGQPIVPGTRFCAACGTQAAQPAPGTRLAASAPPRIVRNATTSQLGAHGPSGSAVAAKAVSVGSVIALAGAAVALLGFFLPWLVTSDDFVTGWQVLSYGVESAAEVGWNAWFHVAVMLVVLLWILLTALTALLAIRKRRGAVVARVLLALLGLFTPLFWALAVLLGQQPSVLPGYGMLLTFAGFVLALVGAFV